MAKPSVGSDIGTVELKLQSCESGNAIEGVLDAYTKIWAPDDDGHLDLAVKFLSEMGTRHFGACQVVSSSRCASKLHAV
jgi:hypothetical protein